MLDREVLGSKEIKQQIERDREERKRKESKGRKIGGDLCRTDYSTLNRVFGWNIGIRGRKPTQSDTQGYGMEEGERDTCVGRGVLPIFCCSIFVFFSSSPHPGGEGPNAPGAQREVSRVYLDIEWKNRWKLSSLPSSPFNFIYIYMYIHGASRPVPANEFRNFPLVNEFLIFPLKSMSPGPTPTRDPRY